jgi:hypothetical protein
VSGFTITKTSVQRDQQWRSAVQKTRSKPFNFGRWPFPFENSDLLSKSENLEGGITSIAEEGSDGDKE